MKPNIQNLLDCAGVDPAWATRNEELQCAVQDGAGGYIPLICQAQLTEEQKKILPAATNTYEEWHSHEITLINGLRGAAGLVNAGSDGVPSIRANTGVGTVATTLGAVQTVFEDKMPWITEHVDLEDLDDFGPDTAPAGPDAVLALERSRYLAEHLDGSGITPYCFDTQGPFDVAHLVVGNRIFYAIYDEPERIHRLLDNCTRVSIRHTREYKEAVGELPDEGRHGCSLAMKGGIRVCEDTPTLLNEEQIHEFVMPYTRKLLQAFGGGWIHYCGRNDHLYNAVLEKIPECYTFNLGNPEMHDMKQVIADCIEHGKTYYGRIPREEGEDTEKYFRRLLGYTQSAGRGLILSGIGGNGMSPPDAVRLWRELQG